MLPAEVVGGDAAHRRGQGGDRFAQRGFDEAPGAGQERRGGVVVLVVVEAVGREGLQRNGHRSLP